MGLRAQTILGRSASAPPPSCTPSNRRRAALHRYWHLWLSATVADALAVGLMVVGWLGAGSMVAAPHAWGQRFASDAPRVAADLTRPQLPDKPQLPVTGDATLHDVQFPSAQVGIAVGDHGSVWKTIDGGATWVGQSLPTDAHFTELFFLDERFGWIVGERYLPLTHRSQGVIFRTADGGTTWSPMSTKMQPALRAVRFFNPRSGLVAGECSSFFPNGITRTRDGGLGWTAAFPGGGPHIVTGEFLREETYLVAGHRGWVAKVQSGTVVEAGTPPIGDRTIRDIQMVDEKYGWLVGDGGLILRTDNGGLSWTPLPQQHKLGLADGFDWQSVATQGNQVWIAGSPGSVILHSTDAGRTWHRRVTGQTLPLYAIRFRSNSDGVAVGALGTILTTRDGGQTWRTARREAPRCALLVFSAEPSDVAWETIARYGAADGWLTVLDTTFRRDVELRDTSSPSIEPRLRAAVLRAGGSDAHRAWQFPLRQPGVEPPPAQVYDAWAQLHGGDPRQRLLDYLVRQIRTWKPTVIVGPVGDAIGPQAMLSGLLADAMDRAADAEQHLAQQQTAALPPWQVTRLVLSDPDEGHDAPQRFHTSRLSSRQGETVGAVAATARMYVESSYRSSPDHVGIRILKDHAPTGSDKQDLFSGLSRTSAETMRKQEPSLGKSVQDLSEVATRVRNIERILAHQLRAEEAINVGVLESLGRGLPPQAALAVLLQMEAVLREKGETLLAQDVLQRIQQEHPGTPYAEWAAIRLVQELASSEQAWALREVLATVPANGHVVQAAATDVDDNSSVAVGLSLESGERKIRLASGVSSSRPSISLRRQAAIDHGEKLLQTRLDLMAEPSIGFPVAAARRQEGSTERAAGFYRLLQSQGIDSAWTLPAKKELWLHQPRGTNPPENSHPAKLADERPLLDGRFDEPMWKEAKTIRLESVYHDDEAWPCTLRLAHDAEYLYLAATCGKTSADRYPVATPRSRLDDLADETPLRHWDRVEIAIDIDRDYTSFYTLAIDCRGAVSDRLQHDVRWDPTWYVADYQAADSWGFEAAIAWNQLVPAGHPRDEALFRFARIAPQTGVQGWNGDAAVDARPAGFQTVSFRTR